MKIDLYSENTTGGSTSDPDHPKAGACVDADSGLDQEPSQPQDSGNPGAEQA